MDLEASQAAARWLYEQHEACADAQAFPIACRPRGIADAHAIQEALIAHREAQGERVTGWKIALTTAVMQQFVGIDHPCAGAIYAHTEHASHATVRAADYVHLNVEAEIAVRVATDMPAGPVPYARDNVSAHIACAMAAIELVDDRNCTYDPLDVQLLLADNSFNKGCVLGPPVDNLKDLDLSAVAGQMVINQEVVGEGTGADMLGHPLDAFAWIANHLLSRGRQLHAGNVVLLGSISPPRWLKAGDTMTSRMRGLGESTVNVV